jgi:hypothetical protein
VNRYHTSSATRANLVQWQIHPDLYRAKGGTWALTVIQKKLFDVGKESKEIELVLSESGDKSQPSLYNTLVKNTQEISCNLHRLYSTAAVGLEISLPSGVIALWMELARKGLDLVLSVYPLVSYLGRSGRYCDLQLRRREYLGSRESLEEDDGNDHGCNRVSGKLVLVVLYHCSYVVRASVNVWLC